MRGAGARGSGQRAEQLAGVGHDHRMAQRGQQPRNPRAVRAGLHDGRRARIPGAKRGQHFARVHNRFLGEDLARGIEDAHMVAAIPEVQSGGQFFTSRYFGIHKAGHYTPLLIPTG